MRLFLGALCLTLLVGLPAQSQVTYESLSLRNGDLSPHDGSEIEVVFSGLRVDGRCLRSDCTADVSLRVGRGSQRLSLVVEPLMSDRPSNERLNDSFGGDGLRGEAARRRLAELTPRMRLFVAWSVAMSSEIIALARTDSGVNVAQSDLWRSVETRGEAHLREALGSLASELQRIDRASNGATVVREVIQPALTRMNLYSGAIDGQVGPLTDAAIKEFQTRAGRLPTGVLDATEMRLLRDQDQQNDYFEYPDATISFAELSVLRGRLLAAESARDALLTRVAALEEMVNRVIASEGETVPPEAPIEDVEAALALTLNRLVDNRATRPNTDDLQRRLARSEAMQRELTERLSALTAALESREVEISESPEVLSLSQQVSALTALLTDTRAEIAREHVPVAAYRAVETERDDLRQRVRSMRAEFEQNFVPREEATDLESQVSALTALLTDTRAQMEREHVPVAAYQTVEAERDELREQLQVVGREIEENYVPRSEAEALRSQISSLNQLLVEIRQSIERDFVPITELATLQQQVLALTASITDLQLRNDRQQRRMREAELLLEAFRADCRQIPECARALGLAAD